MWHRPLRGGKGGEKTISRIIVSQTTQNFLRVHKRRLRTGANSFFNVMMKFMIAWSFTKEMTMRRKRTFFLMKQAIFPSHLYKQQKLPSKAYYFDIWNRLENVLILRMKTRDKNKLSIFIFIPGMPLCW